MFKHNLLLSVVCSTIAVADDWDKQKYNFRWMHVSVCGDSAEIQRYLKDNDFRLDSVSIGRKGS